MKLGVPVFGAYMSRVVMSCLTVLLVRIKCPLSLLINFALKSILTNITTEMPVVPLSPVSFDWGIFDHPATLRQCLVSIFKT